MWEMLNHNDGTGTEICPGDLHREQMNQLYIIYLHVYMGADRAFYPEPFGEIEKFH